MTTPSLDLESVSKWLLDNQYFLSGLELYQETLENGSPCPLLVDFFTPDRIETFVQKEELSEWLETSESIRSPRGNQKMEPIPSTETLLSKLSTLEYSLRREMHQRQNLRLELANITRDLEVWNLEDKSNTSEHPPTTLEKRILHFIIHKYLMEQDLKKSAVSLSSEVSDLVNITFSPSNPFSFLISWMNA